MSRRLVVLVPSAEHGVMRPRRFKAESLEGEVVTLDEAQSRHAVTVLRLKVGDTVTLFDGQATEAVGEIVDARANGLGVRVVERRTVAVRAGSLTLVVATPKGERADWMMEKCAELGVNTIVPLLCERGHVTPGKGKHERWRRKAEESAKQSQQTTIMRIDEASSLDDALMTIERSTIALFGDPRADASMWTTLGSTPSDTNMTIIIGPEGGFSDNESLAMRERGAKPVRIAESILRVETAAVAAAGVWAAWRSDSPRE